jgi:hypothetical protein
MTFIESNTVAQMLFDTVAKLGGKQASVLHRNTRLSGFSL